MLRYRRALLYALSSYFANGIEFVNLSYDFNKKKSSEALCGGEKKIVINFSFIHKDNNHFRASQRQIKLIKDYQKKINKNFIRRKRKLFLEKLFRNYSENKNREEYKNYWSEDSDQFRRQGFVIVENFHPRKKEENGNFYRLVFLTLNKFTTERTLRNFGRNHYSNYHFATS